MTLRARLTAAFVLVVLVPLLVVVALVTSALPAAVAERQEQGALSGGRLAAEVLTGLCGRAQAAAAAVARAAAVPSDDAALQDDLTQLVRLGLADGVRVVDGAGRTAASGSAQAGEAPVVPERDCAAGGVARAGGALQVAAVVGLARSAGPAGAAVAGIAVDDALARSLRDAVGSGQVVLLVGGQPVAASGDVPPALLRAALQAGGGPVRVDGAVAALVPARAGQPVAVLLTQPPAGSGGVLPRALVVAAVAVLLAAGIALLLARATTRPLGELRDAAARVAAGDLDATIEVRSRDEVGQLGVAFNAMTEDLRGYVGALEASRDELQAGLARIGDALSGTHDLDRILAVVLETAMASTSAEAGAVLLLGPDRSDLELAVGRGLDERGAARGLRLPYGSGLVGRVASTGQPLQGRIADLEPDPAEPRGRTVLAVPLRSATTVIGVLALYDRAGGEGFDEADLATLRAFTSQATVAVDNVLLHEEARRLSITDGLTGIWNYRYFTMTIGKEIERAARFGRPLALLLLDLDHFKPVNDVHGHQRGDAVLIELAGRLKAQVRDVDTLARYGGEEFVVLLPETDEAGATLAAERIRAAVRQRPFGDHGETPLAVTLSVGVAVFPAHGQTPAALLRAADQALYAAKGAGRDTWRLAAAGVES